MPIRNRSLWTSLALAMLVTACGGSGGGGGENTNNVPIANAQSISTNEDTPVNGQLTGSDADGDALTFMKASDPSNGTVTVQANGSFTYTPDLDFAGSEIFGFRANDGTDDSLVAEVSITVTAAPEALDDSFDGTEETPLMAAAPGALVNDTNSSGAATGLTAEVVTPPANGTLVLATDGSFTYTPNTNFAGADNFSYRALEGSVASQAATVTLNIANSPDSPIAGNDSPTTDEDSTVLIDVLANDYDPDTGDTISVVAFDATGLVGLLTDNGNGIFSYNPDGNFEALAIGESDTTSFTYTIESTGGAEQTSATVTITVDGVNDLPTVGNDVYVIVNGGFESGDLTGWSVSLQGTDAPFYGVLSGTTLPSSSNTTVGPASGMFYAVSDQNAPSVNVLQQTFSLPPGLTELPLTFDQFLNNLDPLVIDPVGLALGVSNQHGRIDLMSGIATDFDTTAGVIRNLFIGGDQVTAPQPYTPFQIDIGPDVSAGGTFKLRFGQAGNNFFMNMGVDNVKIGSGPGTDDNTLLLVDAADSLLANDSDIDGSDTLSVTAFDAVSTMGADVLVNADGSFSYDPTVSAALNALTTGEHALDSFTYTADDGNGGTQVATVTMQVQGINDAPVMPVPLQPQNVSQDTATVLQLSATDVEGDLLAFTITQTTTQGVLDPVVSTGDTTATVLYTPGGGYVGPDSFEFEVDDGNGGITTATLLINVGDVNDPPVADPQSLTTDEDVPLLISLTGIDVDGDALTFSIITPPTLGTLGVVTSTGDFTAQITYTPNANIFGPDSFNFQVDDGNGETASATVSIDINPVNDLPVDIGLDNAMVDENQPALTLVGTLSTSDQDLPADSHSYALVAGTGDTHNGLFSMQGNQLVTAAELDFEASPSLTVRIRSTDSGAAFMEKALTITVNDLNDSPVAVTDQYNGAIGNTLFAVGTAVTGEPAVNSGDNDLLANDTDEPGSVLATVSTATTSANGGDVVIGSDGSFTYLPPVGFTGTDSFTYTVTDGVNNTDGTAEITVGSMIWYVDSTPAGADNDGRSRSPFLSLANVNGASDPGDTIFVYAGTQITGINLQNDQILQGEGGGLVVNSVPLVPAGVRPVISVASGTAIFLGANNTISDIDISSSQTGIVGINSGNTSISGMALATGGGVALELVFGTLNINLDSLSSNGGAGIVIEGASGNLRVSGATTVTNGNGPGILLTNSGGASFNFNSLSIQTANGAGLHAANAGTISITDPGTVISVTDGPALVIENTFGIIDGVAGWQFDTLTSTNSSSEGIRLDNISDNVTITGSADISDSAGNGIDIRNSTGNVNIASVIITNSNRAPSPAGPGGLISEGGIILEDNAGDFTLTGGVIQFTVDNSVHGVRASNIENLSISGEPGGASPFSIFGASKGSGIDNAHAIHVLGANSVIFDDLDIAQIGLPNSNDSAIVLEDVDDITVTNSGIAEVDGNSIDIFYDPALTAGDVSVTLTGNTFNGNGTDYNTTNTGIAIGPFASDTAARLTADILNNTSSGVRQFLNLQLGANSGTSVDRNLVTVRDNSIFDLDNDGIDITVTDDSESKVIVGSNTIDGLSNATLSALATPNIGISVEMTTSSTNPTTANADVFITGNIIREMGAEGIRLREFSDPVSGTLTTSILNNSISRTGDESILIEPGNTVTMNTTIQGNVIFEPNCVTLLPTPTFCEGPAIANYFRPSSTGAVSRLLIGDPADPGLRGNQTSCSFCTQIFLIDYALETHVAATLELGGNLSLGSSGITDFDNLANNGNTTTGNSTLLGLNFSGTGFITIVDPATIPVPIP